MDVRNLIRQQILMGGGGAYHDLFDSKESVLRQWDGCDLTDKDIVLFASYTYESYSGSAYILFIRNGILMNDSCSHCSCNGLIDWRPMEVEPETVMSNANYHISQSDERYRGLQTLAEALIELKELKQLK